MLLEIAVLGLFPAAMIYAAASDLVTMTISNRVSLALFFAFFAIAVWIGMPFADMGRHLAASAIVLAVAFGFFARGWIGGGDAKLAAATALWLGFSLLMDYLLVAAVIGGALTLAILQARKWPLPYFLARHGWIVRLHAVETGIPYGIALAAAGLIVYPDTVFMHAAGSVS
ncbi:MAG TPA: prepilin peptidase [Xanthobacteraceae bacterium]|nr:prepilin peptidase [Xanthobacteraceae bacterium]